MSEWLRNILPVIIAAGAGILVYAIGGRHPPAQTIGSRRKFVKMMKKGRIYGGINEKLTEFFEKNGVTYHYGKRCSPMKLTIVSLLLWITGFFTGSVFSAWTGLIAGMLLAGMPWILIPILNKSDNEKMLGDLKTIYHGLAIQIKAGVYVTDALAEMYEGVCGIRLREALLDLGGDIVMKSDLFSALEKFQAKFDNRYIDSLCITVLQAMESGQAVELLGDIAEQVKDMEKTVMEKKKGKLDRSITFYQLGMLSCILAVTVYACVGYLLEAAVNI